MRHHSRHRHRPDRSKPPRGDPTRAELIVATACLLVLGAWILSQPVVLLAMVVTLALATMVVVLPLLVIRLVAAAGVLLTKGMHWMRHLRAQRSTDRAERDRGEATEQ